MSKAGLPAWRKEPVVQVEPLPAPGRGRVRSVCGIDVARETHHAVALDGRGQRLIDRPLPNAEPDFVALFAELEAHGRILVVVDQLASIGAPAVAVARSRGITVAYLPRLSMRRIADLYPGGLHCSELYGLKEPLQFLLGLGRSPGLALT